MLHTQLELEAEVGIEQVKRFPPPLPIHSESLRHQRHAVSYISNIPIIKHFRRFVKPRQYAPINHPVLSNYSAKTRSLALSLALIPSALSYCAVSLREFYPTQESGTCKVNPRKSIRLIDKDAEEEGGAVGGH
jgi:hypothetical protein